MEYFIQEFLQILGVWHALSVRKRIFLVCEWVCVCLCVCTDASMRSYTEHYQRGKDSGDKPPQEDTF